MPTRKRAPQRRPDKTTLTISLPVDLKEAIEKAAAADHRTTSNFVVLELMKLIKKEGDSETHPQG